MRSRYDDRRHRRWYPDDRSPYDDRYARRRWPSAFDAGEPERRRGRGVRTRERPGRDRERAERRHDWRERWERMKERERERGWAARGREFFRRYREPIVGLTMAGLAAPLAKELREAPPEEPPEAAAARAAARVPRPGVELEEAIGRRVAGAEREDTIRTATRVYGIQRALAEDIYDHALRADIDPVMAFGLVKTESAFDRRAVSNVGARGLTQVMPRTARWLRPGTTAEDLYDRHINLGLGLGYLRDLIDKYNGNERLALLAYNRGPGTVDRVLRQGGDPDNGYADMVLSGYEDLGR